MSDGEVGRTKDVGFQIGVRRTVPYTAAEVWDLLTGPAGLSVWLGEGAALTDVTGSTYSTDDGTSGEVRSYREHDRIRLTWRPATWSHDTTVQVSLLPAATGTAILFHQERLADSEERERQREHWRQVIEGLIEVLEG